MNKIIAGIICLIFFMFLIYLIAIFPPMAMFLAGMFIGQISYILFELLT
jgi:hypothetical protein